MHQISLPYPSLGYLNEMHTIPVVDTFSTIPNISLCFSPNCKQNKSCLENDCGLNMPR